MTHPIQQWHAFMDAPTPDGLSALLHDDVVFHSPVVHTPQRGKALTFAYLWAAGQTLKNPGFGYVREVVDGNTAMLEFRTDVDGITINGVDLIEWDEDGLITDFKVMVRPLKAMNKLHEQMAAMLEQMKAKT